jgi:hypothetical protein
MDGVVHLLLGCCGGLGGQEEGVSRCQQRGEQEKEDEVSVQLLLDG